MKKLKRIGHSIITDNKIQCFAAILACEWFGPVVATLAVIVAEMVYIAVDVLTRSNDEISRSVHTTKIR